MCVAHAASWLLTVLLPPGGSVSPGASVCVLLQLCVCCCSANTRDEKRAVARPFAFLLFVCVFTSKLNSARLPFEQVLPAATLEDPATHAHAKNKGRHLTSLQAGCRGRPHHNQQDGSGEGGGAQSNQRHSQVRSALLALSF